MAAQKTVKTTIFETCFFVSFALQLELLNRIRLRGKNVMFSREVANSCAIPRTGGIIQCVLCPNVHARETVGEMLTFGVIPKPLEAIDGLCTQSSMALGGFFYSLFWRVMRKTEQLIFRAEPKHEEKIQQIRKATGLKTSVILRKMIEHFDPADVIGLSQKAESNGIRQDTPVAFSS